MKNIVEKFGLHELLIASARYYAGRMTIGACCFADTLAECWNEIPKETRDIIRRDLDGLFAQDDRMRFSKKCSTDRYPLGQDVDREHWEKVRKAWWNEKAD